ncbi:ser/thr phosphatase [Thioploca ingrica]|uniref:Ser/thr phosphatase n=1 Tax=Thioploca ingrica TaxID=40754 RepID=A0A090AJL8_9GAMM|nr:ser/thr phosphatase [Thioploca ingrica]
MQLHLDYRQDVLLIKQQMIQIEMGYLASLANSLWLIALESVDLPMQGILRLPILLSLVLTHLNPTRPDKLDQVGYAFHEMRSSLIPNLEKCQSANEIVKKLPVQNEHLSDKLNIIKRLQQILLPKESELNQIVDLDISGLMLPADEVSGDYYEVFEHNGRIIVGIGDVTGHGLESGLLALMVQITVRTLLINNISEPKIVLNFLNEALYDNIKRMNLRRSLTLSLLEYHEGVLTISGQHEEIIIIRLNGYLERIDTIDLGLMIGLKKDISQCLNQIQVTLQPGEGLVLYTDGITEAKNANKVEYGLDRLCEVIKNHGYRSATAIQQAILNDVRQHMDNQKIFDDLTLLVLKRNKVEKELEI